MHSVPHRNVILFLQLFLEWSSLPCDSQDKKSFKQFKHFFSLPMSFIIGLCIRNRYSSCYFCVYKCVDNWEKQGQQAGICVRPMEKHYPNTVNFNITVTYSLENQSFKINEKILSYYILLVVEGTVLVFVLKRLLKIVFCFCVFIQPY